MPRASCLDVSIARGLAESSEGQLAEKASSGRTERSLHHPANYLDTSCKTVVTELGSHESCMQAGLLRGEYSFVCFEKESADILWPAR